MKIKRNSNMMPLINFDDGLLVPGDVCLYSSKNGFIKNTH